MTRKIRKNSVRLCIAAIAASAAAAAAAAGGGLPSAATATSAPTAEVNAAPFAGGPVNLPQEVGPETEAPAEDPPEEPEDPGVGDPPPSGRAGTAAERSPGTP